MRRVHWIILDGVGLGALPDAGAYGDAGAATLPHVAMACGGLSLPNLAALGLGHLAEIQGVPRVMAPRGGYGRMAARSAGKDSTTGHWELAGVILEQPFATYPQGFPDELVAQFASIAGAEPLGNVPASGISILKTFGEEHLRTGRPILYTSVDSVFQIATHEDVYPLDTLYALCRKSRALVDDWGIGRVIARPFSGAPGSFRRLPERKDFSMPPPSPTVLERLTMAGWPVHGVGKIRDLFAGCGVQKSSATIDNQDGMQKSLDAFRSLDRGLLVTNLIDFDMVYGHRRDAGGFGAAMEAFDVWLPEMMAALTVDDLLIITADHGCDPTTPGSDHTREYVPVIAWSPKMQEGAKLGDRQTFADVGETLADCFDLPVVGVGESFLRCLI